MMLRCCPSCASGLLRYDPQTGDYGCACGLRTGGYVPPVMGGQGRDGEDVAETGRGLAWVFLAGAVLGAVLVAGAMLAGG